METNQQPPPQYKNGDPVYDNQGNLLGTAVHRYYNDYTGQWSYTVADNMSYYTGRFTYFTPSNQ